MKLKGRLDRLEPVTRERWHASWRELLDLAEGHMGDAMLDRVISVGERDAAGTLDEDAVDAALIALDYGLEPWSDLWEMPELEGRDFHLTPERIPPPPEPEGAHDRLIALLETEGAEGDAAGTLLYFMAMARGVSEYRAKRGR